MTTQEFIDRKLDGHIDPSANYRDGWRDVDSKEFDDAHRDAMPAKHPAA